MMAPACIPSMAQQISALALAADARRRASYAWSQRTTQPAERARNAEFDRLALALIAKRPGATGADLAAAHPSRTHKGWTARLRTMLERGWIEVVPERNARRTGVQPNRYTITDTGRAMLATLSASARTPDGE